jgi:hypothetical protein
VLGIYILIKNDNFFTLACDICCVFVPWSMDNIGKTVNILSFVLI